MEAFRDQVPVLLCTESGGEGRNLQFCNTLINFDIPWNPMAIEQRIGRIDRIGQTREVFIFNLVTAGTIEDAVLRILDEKINMFELVVGEVGAILGEVDEQQDFSTLVLDAWLQSTEQAPRRRLRQTGKPVAGRASRVRGREATRRGVVRERTRCCLNSIAANKAGCRTSSQRCCATRARWSSRSSPRGWKCSRRPRCSGRWGSANCPDWGSAPRCRPRPSGSASRATGWTAVARLLGPQGRFSRRVLSPAAKTPGDPERVLDHELVLDNATFRLLGRDAGLDALSGAGFPRLGRLGRQARLHRCVWRQPGHRCAAADAMLAARARSSTTRSISDETERRCRRRMPICPRCGIGPGGRAGWRRHCRRRLDVALYPFVTGLRRRLGRDQDRLHRLPQRSASRGHAPRARRCRRAIRGDAGRSSAPRRSDASIAPSSTTCRASMRHG